MKIKSLIIAAALAFSTSAIAGENLWTKKDCEAFSEVATAAATARMSGWDEQRLVKIVKEQSAPQTKLIFTRVVKFVYNLPSDQYKDADAIIWTECMEGYTSW